MDIYAQVAALSIPAGGENVTVFPLTALPNTIPAASLPARLMLPIVSGDGATKQVIVLDAQNDSDVTWAITDLLLLAPLASGTGINQYAASLVGYCADYVAALKNVRLGMGISTITAEPGAYEYPRGSGTIYYGARILIGVRDLIV